MPRSHSEPLTAIRSEGALPPPDFFRPRMYTKPFVLTTLAFVCFFTNVNTYNLLPLYLQALGTRTGEIGAIMAMFSVAAILAQGITGRLLDRG